MAKAKDLLGRMRQTSDAPAPIAIEVPPVEDDIVELEEPITAAPASAAPSAPRPKKPRAPRDGERLPRRIPAPQNSSRMSLDLDRDIHKQLKQFALFEVEIDASVVGRVLVDLLLEDEALRTRVIERVIQLKRESLEQE